jgi:N-acetylneuraminic acid mutarotase
MTTEGLSDEIYSVDLLTMQFTKLKLDETECKLPKLEHQSTVVIADRLLFIIGGRTYKSPSSKQTVFSSDMYVIDLVTNKVSCQSMPFELLGHAACAINDQFILLYGGWNGNTMLTYFIRYEIQEPDPTCRWTRMLRIPETI